MYNVLLVLHTAVVIALIGIILFQRTGSDGLGSLSGGGSNVMSGRTQANLVTRTTAVLATLFILTSLGLGIMIKQERGPSVFDTELQHEKEHQAAVSPAQDIKNRATEAADKKAEQDAGKTPAPVVEKTPTTSPASAAQPASPAVPKGE